MTEIIPLYSNQLPKGHRRVKKYVLVYCSKGNVEMEIDGIQFDIPSNSVITITSGQYHKFKKTSGANGTVLEFTYDFFCKDDKDIELIFHNGLFCHFDRNEIIEISQHPSIQTQLDLISKELKEKPYQFTSSIHSRIELILIELNRAKVGKGKEIWKPEALFLKFLELIREDFQHKRPVKYYAQVLGTTEIRLNELSKLHAGKTAQQIIHGLIISEAKRLFYYENLHVNETAYALGFNDPFYFSNFFKKHTNLSPQSFKKGVKD
ncbi:helix-turn-helix domain-containing protein [Flagellimonas flava]|uniref:helix-turn-helix domain-containing protein n=1 Tax=Flagellimonas flava TaxID=570519 RepID=UPI003D6626FC